jgi:hypothetical protein
MAEQPRHAARIDPPLEPRSTPRLPPPLSDGVPGPPPNESGMPQEIIDFVESPEGVRVVAAFERITDPKMRRDMARLATKIAGQGSDPRAGL